MILAHGFESSKRYLAEYGIQLAQKEISGYMFDFIGGTMISMSIDNERDELSDAYDYFIRQMAYRKRYPWVCRMFKPPKQRKLTTS